MDNTLNLAINMTNNDWYDIEFKMEREELADLEYLDPLVPIEGEEIDMLDSLGMKCTCDVNEDECELHNVEIDESKETNN